MTEEQVAMLAFEKEWAGRRDLGGAKDQAAYDRFGLNPTRYYQRLNVLIDEQAAVAHDPHTVNRLRRVRASHVRSRSLR